MRSSTRWILIGIVVAVGLIGAINIDHSAAFQAGMQYVVGWGGAIFKALSGGAVGWFVARYVVLIDLSSLPQEQRPQAGLSLALLIAGFAIAVATGI